MPLISPEAIRTTRRIGMPVSVIELRKFYTRATFIWVLWLLIPWILLILIAVFNLGVCSWSYVETKS